MSSFICKRIHEINAMCKFFPEKMSFSDFYNTERGHMNSKGNAKIVSLLLGEGADKDIKNNAGKTASEYTFNEKIKLLLQ